METEELLLLQNARFYEAFENADMEAMASVWAHDEHVRCIHPGWAAATGWEAVRAGWEAVFAGGAALRFSLRNVRGRVLDRVGVVFLREEIVFTGDAVRQTVGTETTNVFLFDGGEWRMVLHHASPVVAVDAGDLTYRFN